jgi:hypothetical protein
VGRAVTRKTRKKEKMASFFDLTTDELCHWLLTQDMSALVRPELEKLADL